MTSPSTFRAQVRGMMRKNMITNPASSVSKTSLRTLTPVSGVSTMQKHLALILRGDKVSIVPHESPPAYDCQPCNVIVFGETGSGKSSVINLIAGAKLAETSSDAASCTFTSTPYHVVLQGNKPFCIWDTVGLNEPEISHEDYLRAIKQAYKLIKKLERSEGVHLLLLCMRGGRITNSLQQNYNLFVKMLCETRVPLAVVVTNLENEPCMEEWWTTNKGLFERYGISADGHACITASPGMNGVFLGRYKESRETIRRLLLELSSRDSAWKKDRRSWLVDLIGKMAGILPLRHGRPRRPTHEELKKRLISECKFSKKDAVEIANSIEVIREQAAQSCC